MVLQTRGEYMNSEWESLVSNIIQESVEELELLKCSRQEKEELKRAKAEDIKNILLPKLYFIMEQFKQNIPKAVSIYTQDHAYVTDSQFEIKLVMPTLSEVNQMDLLFKIEFDEEEVPVLNVYNKFSDDKVEFLRSTDKEFSSFIEDCIVRFILSWYKRKLGDELAKDRMISLKIRSETLK
jgi:hypothetical protein